MKTVTDKYLEMNHNFIQLRDSIVQKVENEKAIDNGILNDVFIAMGVLNHFLDIYKETNEVKTRVKEDDEFVKGDIYYPDTLNNKNKECDNGAILSNSNAWKSLKE